MADLLKYAFDKCLL